MESWELENVEIRAEENPDSFFIPSIDERDNQKVGDLVRLHFKIKDRREGDPHAERMWVGITKAKSSFSGYTGLLTNRPAFIKDLSRGDEIEFDSMHIAQTTINKDSPFLVDSLEKYALVSKKCLEPGGAVRFLYREEPDEEGDSGWRIFSGIEDDEYANNPENISIVNVGYLLNKDPTLLLPLKGQIGATYERNEKDQPWELVDDWNPEED